MSPAPKPHTPRPATIGIYLQDIGKLLRDEISHERNKTHCRCIDCTAERLALIGWPVSTTGDGRGSNDIEKLNGVEAAATMVHPYEGIDLEVRKVRRMLWLAARMTEDIYQKVRKHESDTEKAAGLGNCEICERFCNPRKNPNDRLRGSWCPACVSAWRRWIDTNPDGLRPDFIRHRRATLLEPA